jgi:hypothetical protein
LKVQFRAAEKGVMCSRPTMEGCRYDLILDDGQLHRAQCKYVNAKASHSTGAVMVHLVKRNSHGKGPGRLYTADEVDVFLVYIPAIEQVLWIPKEVWLCKSTLNLRLTPAKNGQTKKVLLATNFIW